MDIQAYIQSGIIESYVLGLATDTEVAEVEELRLQHAEIAEAIDVFSLSLERHALENAVAPPADVRVKIFNEIETEDQSVTPLLPLSKGSVNSTTPLRTLRIWRFAAAASVILFIVSAAFNFYLFDRFRQSDTAYQSLLIERNSLQANNQIFQTRLREWTTGAEMMADPKMAMIKMTGVKEKGDMATIFWDTQSKDVYVMTNKLPKVTTGKQYQLWAIVGGKPVDAGTLDPTCTSVCKMKNIPQAQAFAITLENSGGSTSPTMEAMYVMGKV